jgi:hypothetical protein
VLDGNHSVTALLLADVPDEPDKAGERAAAQ